MNLDAITDFSFVRPLAPLLFLLFFLAALLPFLRRPGKERLFFGALGLFFCAATAVFLLLGQPFTALSVFLVPAILYGIFLKTGRNKK
jgi:hypothetical protein